jgi:hypothetical protein
VSFTLMPLHRHFKAYYFRCHNADTTGSRSSTLTFCLGTKTGISIFGWIRQQPFFSEMSHFANSTASRTCPPTKAGSVLPPVTVPKSRQIASIVVLSRQNRRLRPMAALLWQIGTCITFSRPYVVFRGIKMPLVIVDSLKPLPVG